VDRDRVGVAPQGVLSVEQIATLPCAGVPAFQAMQTLCADLPRGSKILVLNAHVGVGALAMQLAGCLRRQRDLWITAQVPITVSDGDALCRGYGASETLRDDPIPVLHALHESSYDAILDTVGGRRVYDAARRVLHHEGIFVTVVGDELAPPTAKAQWKAGFRSLRRAFIKKDKKAISYMCVRRLRVLDQDQRADSMYAAAQVSTNERSAAKPSIGCATSPNRASSRPSCGASCPSRTAARPLRRCRMRASS
jgi:NADPH:quinone reductase-like Zn-dependent oxidoreductase